VTHQKLQKCLLNSSTWIATS